MSDETYYTVLNVKETASASEIKTAYRDLIKQVHPDTLANLAPYLRKIAEDKAKEITEAYGVLSNSSKRRDYDNQLAAYRRQSAPQATPTPPTPESTPSQGASTSSFGYCTKCGTALYASGYCPKCSKFAASSATRAQTPARPTQPRAVRRFGYNWGPLLDWVGKHPLMVAFLFVIGVASIGALFSDSNTSQSSASGSSSAGPTPATNNAKAASTGPYSAFPCDFRDNVSPIDGKPCRAGQDLWVPAPPLGLTPVSEEPPSKATVTVSGTYVGTVHNKTVNLSSTVAAVFRQSKTGVLEGCMQVKPPLYGSGTVQGTVRGVYVNFAVADIAFHGDALKTSITGSYVVSRQDGQQLGDFRIEKRKEGDPRYYCKDGMLTEALTDVPEVIIVPRERPKTTIAVVTSDYASIEKRCAFLPTDNYGRCNYQPETIARPRKYDRLTILSPLTRAENGEDIYKVRTAQGWEGWINSKFVQIQY